MCTDDPRGIDCWLHPVSGRRKQALSLWMCYQTASTVARIVMLDGMMRQYDARQDDEKKSTEHFYDFDFDWSSEWCAVFHVPRQLLFLPAAAAAAGNKVAILIPQLLPYPGIVFHNGYDVCSMTSH